MEEYSLILAYDNTSIYSRCPFLSECFSPQDSAYQISQVIFTEVIENFWRQLYQNMKVIEQILYTKAAYLKYIIIGDYQMRVC